MTILNENVDSTALDADSGPVQDSQAAEIPTRTEADYQALLVAAQGHEAKAKLLDELMDDPEFLSVVDKYENGIIDEKPAAVPAPVVNSEEDAVVTAVRDIVKPIVEEMDNMKAIYQKDKVEATQSVINKTVDQMADDPVNYPFYKQSMVKMSELFEQGRVVNLQDAYDLASSPYARAAGAQAVKDKKGPANAVLSSVERAEVDPGKEKPVWGKKNTRLKLLLANADKLGIE